MNQVYQLQQATFTLTNMNRQCYFPTARGWRQPFSMDLHRLVEVMCKYRTIYGMVA